MIRDSLYADNEYMLDCEWKADYGHINETVADDDGRIHLPAEGNVIAMNAKGDYWCEDESGRIWPVRLIYEDDESRQFIYKIIMPKPGDESQTK